jgi:hypothetical protein
MLVDEVSTQFPKNLSGIHSRLIDWTRKPMKDTQIVVIENSTPWLIKVNRDRCPVCGTVEKSKDDWCDPSEMLEYCE